MKSTVHSLNPVDNRLFNELNPQVRKWILRILVPLGGMHKFVGYGRFDDEVLAYGLKLVSDNDDKYEARNEGIDEAKQKQLLKKQYATTVGKHYPLPETLIKNVRDLATLTGLSATDCRLLEFAVTLHMDARLATAGNYLGDEISTNRLYSILSFLLDLPEASVRESLGSQSLLHRAGLLSVDRGRRTDLKGKLDLLSDQFAETLYCENACPQQLLRGKVKIPEPAKLTQQDYSHIHKPLAVLLPYLRHCLQQGKTGVNILLYGQPGTGKTELAKLIAKETGSKLYEISSEDEDGDPNTSYQRLKAYRAAQYFFTSNQNLMLFDEVEDIFAGDDGLSVFKNHQPLAAQHKAWVNHTLEHNTIPTFWISNRVHGMDAAFVRRFDMVIEVPQPDKTRREKLVRQYCENLLDENSIKRMAEVENLSPAVIERTAHVVGSITKELNDTGQVMEMLLNNTLQIQGYKTIEKRKEQEVAEIYDPAFIHADTDMAAIADGLKKHQSGRLCLYGPPGTGKTAYGRWLAEQLQKPLIIRRASDLLSKWLGDTEQNMAQAFRQAEDEQAILMIDEVDSFLQDRRGAQHSWQVSQVNEMLTQMESFDGIFVASTNLMDGLDQAALRRFDLKAKFGFLQPQQAWQLFCRYCQQLQLDAGQGTARLRLYDIQNLTPGDFAAVMRQSRFRPLRSADDFAAALLAEVAIKEKPERSIGFLRH